VVVDRPWEHKDAPQADALVTNKPGIVLGILTADCLPILFADTKKKIIGAAHAGWKGAFDGVIESTLEAMHKLGADDIIATIGPAIAQKSYEVGPEFIGRFVQQHIGNVNYFIPSAKPDHHLFDLPGYAQQRLQQAGITKINLLAHDTCFEENRFFSYRRSCLRGKKSYGRQVSAIMFTL
jgi:YfiH family protein